MKKIYILFIFLTIAIYCQGQTTQTLINKIWEEETGTPDTIKWQGTSYDSQGNIITAGNTTNGITTDMLLTKYDAHGNQLWQVTYDNNSYSDYGVAVIAGNNDTLFVVGTSMTSVGHGFDYLIQQYDPDGNLIWTTTYNGPGSSYDVATSVVQDTYGFPYVTGTSTGSGTDYDYCTLKLSHTGSILWTERYDNDSLKDVPVKIGIDGYVAAVASLPPTPGYPILYVIGASETANNREDYFLTGYNGLTGHGTSSYRDASPWNGFSQVFGIAMDTFQNIVVTGSAFNGTDYDIHTIEVDNNLNVLWTADYDGYGYNDKGNDVAVDLNGNVYVTGSTGKDTLKSNGILLNYDPSGNLIWDKTISPDDKTLDFRSMKMYMSPSNEITIASCFKETGNYKINLMTFDLSGNQIWSHDFSSGGSDDDFPTSIKADENNDLFLAYSSFGLSDKYGVVKYSPLTVPLSPVNDSAGKPAYIHGQLIVEFDTSIIKKDFVNNKDLIWGNISDIISDDAISEINSHFKFNFGDLRAYKVFTRMTTSDTFSITRTGRRIPIDPFWSNYVVLLPDFLDDSAMKSALSSVHPLIHFAKFNELAHLSSVPNDSLYLSGQFAGFTSNGSITDANINIEPAWDIAVGDTSIKVGVYDGGINFHHKDFGNGTLIGSKIKGGYDYVFNQPISVANPPDQNCHGTACAGIIGALRNNNKGVPGIAGGDMSVGNTGCSLYDMRIFLIDTATSLSNIANAIFEGAVNDTATGFGFGLDVINISWGMQDDTLLKRVIRTAFQNEVVLACASGNDENSSATQFAVTFPAGYKDEWVLKVGANDSTGARVSFSNCAPDFIAPGMHNLYTCLSLDNQQYSDTMFGGYLPPRYLNGTSFAAPHAAGLAALMLGYVNTNPFKPNNLAPEDVEHLIQKYSTDITASPDTIGYDYQTGWGRINAGNTLINIQLPYRKVVHYQFNVDASNATSEALSALYVRNNFDSLAQGPFCRRYRITGIDTFNTNGYQLLDAWKRLAPVNLLAKIDSLVPTYSENYIPHEEDFTFDSTVGNVAYMHGYIYEIFGTNYITSAPDTIWYPFDTSGIATFAYSIFIGDSSFNQVSNEIPTVLFTVFPNPADNEYAIEISTMFEENLNLHLYDITGRKIKDVSLGKVNGSHIFHFKSDYLADGVYIVKLDADHKTITRKLVVQH